MVCSVKTFSSKEITVSKNTSAKARTILMQNCHEVSVILGDNLLSPKFNNRLIIRPNLFILSTSYTICDALRDLIPFVQFKKREKHPWRSVNFSKVAGFNTQYTTFSQAFSTLYLIYCSVIQLERFYSLHRAARLSTQCLL